MSCIAWISSSLSRPKTTWKDTPASVWKSELSGTPPGWVQMQPSRAPRFQSSAQFPGHSQHPWPRKERKDGKSVGFVLTHWHLLMLIWHCLWVLLLGKSQLFSQKCCHLALAVQPKLQENLKQTFWSGRRKQRFSSTFCRRTLSKKKEKGRNGFPCEKRAAGKT